MMLDYLVVLVITVLIVFMLWPHRRKKVLPDAVFAFHCPDTNFYPSQATPGAGGFDLYSPERLDLPAGKSMMVRSGVRPLIPDGYVGIICPRSSMAAKHNLRIGARIIDSDFRGDMFINLYNDGEQTYEIKAGDRIAQILIVPCVTNSLPISEWAYNQACKTQRGAGELGSTGR